MYCHLYFCVQTKWKRNISWSRTIPYRVFLHFVDTTIQSTSATPIIFFSSSSSSSSWTSMLWRRCRYAWRNLGQPNLSHMICFDMARYINDDIRTTLTSTITALLNLSIIWPSIILVCCSFSQSSRDSHCWFPVSRFQFPFIELKICVLKKDDTSEREQNKLSKFNV